MAMLFWIVVILLLILTGAILPILHFALWALLVILMLTLLVWAFLRLCGLVLRPFVLLGSDVVDAVRGRDHPKPDDPDYKHSIDWANRTGEFPNSKKWINAKRLPIEGRP